MMTRNKGQKKSIVSELGLVSTRNSKQSNSSQVDKQKNKANKSTKHFEVTKNQQDDEDCETSIDEFIPNPTNSVDEKSCSPFVNINEKDSDDDVKNENIADIKPENDVAPTIDTNDIDEDHESKLITSKSDKILKKERFTCNDGILKGILEFISDCGTLPTPTKRSLTPKPDKSVICQSRIASIVDSLWNEVNINAELDEKDDLLASANLVRPGIFEILKKRREIENKKQTRSVTGRLRPNPRPRNKFSELPSEDSQNPSSTSKNKKFITKKKPRVANRQNDMVNTENGVEMSDTQDGNTICSDISSDTNNDPGKKPSKRKRRTDMKQHITWKFCYPNKGDNDQNFCDKKARTNQSIRNKDIDLSGEEDYSSHYNRSQQSPPPMRADPSLASKGSKTKRRNNNGSCFSRKLSNSDDEGLDAENNAYYEKVKRIWGFKYSRLYNQYESSASEQEDESKNSKISRRSVAKISSKISAKSKRDKLSGLSMFEKLILGLKCTVLIGNSEAYIKELDMRDYQTISKRIEKTNFILKSVSINNGKENLYNIILVHAKFKPGHLAHPNNHQGSKTYEELHQKHIRIMKQKYAYKSLLAKSDFKNKSDDEYTPKSSFYRTTELEKLKELTHSDSAIYDENQKKVRAFTTRLIRRTNMERHRKFLARQMMARRRAGGPNHHPMRELSPDTDPENNTKNTFGRSLYDKKRKNTDLSKRTPGGVKQARLSPSSAYLDTDNNNPIGSYNNINSTNLNNGVGNVLNPQHGVQDPNNFPMANANSGPVRRSSPKKVIRKVYTGTSTLPKILNRNKRLAHMSSINKQTNSSSLSASNSQRETNPNNINKTSDGGDTVNSVPFQSKDNSDNSRALTPLNEVMTNGNAMDCNNEFSDSVSEMSVYSQSLNKNSSNKEKGSPMDYTPIGPSPLQGKNELIYESASPAGSLQSSHGDQAGDLMNPSVSMSASQLLRMKKNQSLTPTPMEVLTLSTTTTVKVQPNIANVMQTGGSASLSSASEMTTTSCATSSKLANSRVLLPRSMENGHEQKMHISLYQEDANPLRSEDEYVGHWSSGGNTTTSTNSTTSSRTLVGYNQTKVILSNPSNNFYLKNATLGFASKKAQTTHVIRPSLTTSKSASNLNLSLMDNNTKHQQQTTMSVIQKNINIKSDMMPSSVVMSNKSAYSHPNTPKITNQSHQQQKNLVHKVHSFRKILPKTNSNLSSTTSPPDSLVNNNKNENAYNYATSLQQHQQNPVNQAKVLKSLLESNQPQKMLQNSASIKINSQPTVVSQQQQNQTGIIGKIGPNGQIINQHNQNAQLNSHQSRGTWKFTQKAHVLSATRTKNGPLSQPIFGQTTNEIINNNNNINSSIHGKQLESLESENHETLVPSMNNNINNNNQPIKVVRLISDNRPVVGQIRQAMGE